MLRKRKQWAPAKAAFYGLNGGQKCNYLYNQGNEHINQGEGTASTHRDTGWVMSLGNIKESADHWR